MTEYHSHSIDHRIPLTNDHSQTITPRLSLTDTDRLLEANERSIEIEKLEKYILGKKSVELEIEFGIPRSQLVRYIDEGLSVGFIKSVIFRAVSKLRKEDQNNDGKIRKFQSFVHEIKGPGVSVTIICQGLIYYFQPSLSAFHMSVR